MAVTELTAANRCVVPVSGLSDMGAVLRIDECHFGWHLIDPLFISTCTWILHRLVLCNHTTTKSNERSEKVNGSFNMPIFHDSPVSCPVFRRVLLRPAFSLWNEVPVTFSFTGTE